MINYLYLMFHVSEPKTTDHLKILFVKHLPLHLNNGHLLTIIASEASCGDSGFFSGISSVTSGILCSIDGICGCILCRVGGVRSSFCRFITSLLSFFGDFLNGLLGSVLRLFDGLLNFRLLGVSLHVLLHFIGSFGAFVAGGLDR